MHPSPAFGHRIRRPRPGLRVSVGVGCLALASVLGARAQNQSLAFTGGVLLNTKVGFSGLGQFAPASAPGPATGGAVDRTYDNGYVRVDDTGNAGDTTVHYGYRSTSQIGSRGLGLTSTTAADTISLDDTGAFLEPSANLEYRGSLGSWGEKDWGVLLGIGYQSVNQEITDTFVTGATVIEDHFGLGSVDRTDMPPGPFAGTASGTAPRIGSVPSRTTRTAPGARVLSGDWEFTSEMIPVTGGLYLEFQLAGRLNGVVSAGMLAAFVNAELRYVETSTVGALPSVTRTGADGTNDFILGGFTQFGLDWAIWENASLVAGARWQPSETFSHSVDGRTAELDFTSAFAVHAGFSMRF
ncbi:MAG: hypothetical protein JNL97_05695 [Verrucomicrobiales bacterium]|nr:hypothetical protein [Verrucomicrobiales bacterium]